MTTETTADATWVLGADKPGFAWLVVLNGPRRGRLFRLRIEGVTVGRAPNNDVVIDDEGVSRYHARLFAEAEGFGPQFYVQDLASANGTFVNAERITKQPLNDEDRLRCGQTMFAFKQL